MALYGLATLLVGAGLLIAALVLVSGLHRHVRVPYALLTVGMITYLGALLIQLLAVRLLNRALLGVLPVGAVVLGIVAGFSEETARALGYQWLARSAVSRAQALMIGAGHGLVPMLYTALIALNVGLSALAEAEPGQALALTDMSRTLAEALNSLLPLAMHMALSWLVLQAFLRGEIGWIFAAIFIHSTVEIGANLFGPPHSWAVAGWRALVALGSLALIRHLAAPQVTAQLSSERS
ncbi:MAG: hypothetical protein Kow00106_25590 [Anaerolineae bacterium]